MLRYRRGCRMWSTLLRLGLPQADVSRCRPGCCGVALLSGGFRIVPGKVGEVCSSRRLRRFIGLAFGRSRWWLSPASFGEASGEFLEKAAGLVSRRGVRPREDGTNSLSLLLSNGSRIAGPLPGTERTVRGFSAVSLLVIDEAARVEDAMYQALRPMLAVFSSGPVPQRKAVTAVPILSGGHGLLWRSSLTRRTSQPGRRGVSRPFVSASVPRRKLFAGWGFCGC